MPMHMCVKPPVQDTGTHVGEEEEGVGMVMVEEVSGMVAEVGEAWEEDLGVHACMAKRMFEVSPALAATCCINCTGIPAPWGQKVGVFWWWLFGLFRPNT